MDLLIVSAFGLQALYWVMLRIGFRRADAVSKASAPGAAPPISVIVAARDEAGRLPDLLRALHRQIYVDYEVIVVDDGSRVETARLLDEWGVRFDRLRVLRTDGIGKKAALTKGIEASRFDLLAFTDADCSPPQRWLSVLAEEHASCTRACMLVGYSPFSQGHGLIGRVARYETFVTGFLTAATIGLRMPYMSVGRNISYPHSVFDRVGGFDSIMHSLSGDDDLFVQEVSRRSAAEIRAVLNPASFVPTDAPSSVREWVRQKRRHASAGRFYAPTIQAHLAAFHGSNLLVWLAPLLAGWLGLALLAAKLVLQYGVLREGAERLQETDLMRLQPLLEPLYLLYNVVIAPIGLMRMPKRW